MPGRKHKAIYSSPLEGFASLGLLAFIVVREVLSEPVLVLFHVVISVVCRGRCCTAHFFSPLEQSY